MAIKMSKHVVVIGGGIIGLCSAYYLQKEGHQVTVVDQSNMDSGASYSFCGISGIPFKGRIIKETTLGEHTAVITEVGGSAHYSGTATFTVEEHDPMPNGLPIPETAGAIWRT